MRRTIWWKWAATLTDTHKTKHKKTRTPVTTKSVTQENDCSVQFYLHVCELASQLVPHKLTEVGQLRDSAKKSIHDCMTLIYDGMMDRAMTTGVRRESTEGERAGRKREKEEERELHQQD